MNIGNRKSLFLMCSSLALLVIVPFSAVMAAQQARLSAGSYTALTRGKYLVRAGDCQACHTAKGGQPFAGGRPVPTPFGVIYSSNITPDPTTGIGQWDHNDFWRAMHEGKNRAGENLYPAFPYPWYTRMSRADVYAIKDYLGTIKPVYQRNPSNKFAWPMNMRSVLNIWNGLFFDPGVYKPDSKKSDQWNRGAYLVRGPGHCGACHSSKNLAGAADMDHPFRGGHGENAFAPNLTGDMRDGLGKWSEDDIVEFLGTGGNNKVTAAGPMAEVVENSTQYLSKSDLRAIAVYLKSFPGNKDKDDSKSGMDSNDKRMTVGAGLYLDNCEGCHMDGGRGLVDVFPPLKDSAAIQAASPQTLISVILQGGRMPVTKQKPTGLAMPAFNDKLSDDQIATLTSYIRNAWGNRASAVSAGQVSDLRKKLKQVN